MPDIATTEPMELTPGVTIKWRREDLTADFPAGGGWALVYKLRNATHAIDIAAAADGDAFQVTVAAATSAAYKAGTYNWIALVSKAGEVYEVGRGTMKVLVDLSVTGGADARSHVKRTLDAIEAVIERRATVDQMSYSIAGRQLGRTPIADLLKLRDKYRSEYAAELGAEAIAAGRSPKRRILTRFNVPA
jgi:hypothetical protein